jgi:hypothetical protein
MIKYLIALGLTATLVFGQQQQAKADWKDFLIKAGKTAGKTGLVGVTKFVVLTPVPLGSNAPLVGYAPGNREEWNRQDCKAMEAKHGSTILKYNGKQWICYSVFN